MSDNTKFGRSYVLRIECNPDGSDDEYIEIAYPLTCEFSIERNTLASNNKANFTIYNLGEITRDRIYKDICEKENWKAVQFFAGYSNETGSNLPRCFNGMVNYAYSQRMGPDFRTVIDAFDGYTAFGVDSVSLSTPAGMSQADQIKQASAEILKNITDMAPPTISDKFKKVSPRILALMGDPKTVAGEVSDGTGYVDNMALYFLPHEDCLDGDVRLINWENGLIGTPKRSNLLVELEMLFEPRIKPSQWIELQTLTSKKLNGVYKVAGIVHKGTISGSVAGDCTTSLTLMMQPGLTVVYDEATENYRVQGQGVEY